MRKYLTILFIALFCFSFVGNAQTKSFKRGTSFNNLSAGETRALAPGASWVYNWGHRIPSNDVALRENNIVYIPMAWSGIDKPTVRNLLRDRPEIKYILGYNEPNFLKQANKSPKAAAEQWIDIEEIADEFGLTIVGPAVNYSPDGPQNEPERWYDEFMAECERLNRRVDHVAIHFYQPGVDKGFIEKFKKYGRPIWVTEFCAWEQSTTVASQKKMMVECFDYMETEPAVFRYAWFKDKAENGGHPYMQLLEQNGSGNLTELGEIFVNLSSYDDNFYHSVNSQIQSEHYIRKFRTDVSNTTDDNGKLDIYGMNMTSWVDYNVNIPEAGEYNVFFRVADEWNGDTQIKLSVSGGNEITTVVLKGKGVGVWSTQSFKSTFASGKQKIRVEQKKNGARINWWGISKSTAPPSGLETIIADDVAIGPNPVKDILNIQTSGNNNEVSLFDISGKCVYSGKNVEEIHMSDFAQGLYLLDIRTENGERIVEKILKEN